MTISCLADAEVNENFYGALEAFVTVTEICPQTTMTVRGYDTFGPKADIPVLLVKLDDLNSQQCLLSFHQAYGQTEPGMSSFLPESNFHISLKFADQAAFRQLPVGTKLTAKRICMKRLGNVPEFYVKDY